MELVMGVSVPCKIEAQIVGMFMFDLLERSLDVGAYSVMVLVICILWFEMSEQCANYKKSDG